MLNYIEKEKEKSYGRRPDPPFDNFL